jgi:hypothetical protein
VPLFVPAFPEVAVIKIWSRLNDSGTLLATQNLPLAPNGSTNAGCDPFDCGVYRNTPYGPSLVVRTLTGSRHTGGIRALLK